MDITILTGIGLSEMQAKIYLYLIEHGLTVTSKIANGIGEKRTTIYSALDKLEKLGLVEKRDKGKISAYSPGHPAVLETIAEKRLRGVARQARNLENNLPSIINYYNEYQHKPGVATFYGREGTKMIWNKILGVKQTLYFVRSQYDSKTDRDALTKFKEERVRLGITAENIAASEFLNEGNAETEKKFLLKRTLLPANEYSSPIEIDIFGDNVAFVNHAKNGMSTLIESPEIADAMRQFFLFSKKYIRKATDQKEIEDKIKISDTK